jgi:hypothetical protein
MRDFRTRLIQVRFTSDPQGDCLRKAGPTRFTVVIPYQLEVKHRLVTVNTATGRAVKLAREIIHRQCYWPPDPDTLA